MKILLVDDEARVLEGLERLLFERDDWEITTAISGADAIELLECSRFDVLVSDMRMPGMDGAELLGIARDRFPAVVRIVLSGQADDVAALRAARVAHQFLSKPCSADVFIPVVERTMALQRYIGDEVIRGALGRVEALPSVPRIYAQLSTALDDDRPAEEIAGIIRQDPAIAAKLLQLVNSSFFVRGRAIADIQTAVVRLGVKVIRDLALTVAIFGRARQALPSCIPIDDMQKQALLAAQLAQKLVAPALAPSAFMAGLLHDVGLLALADAAPTRLCSVHVESCVRRCHASEDERAVMGRGHAEIGAYMLGVWGLPLDIVEAVAHHLSPDRITGPGMTVPAAVYIASTLIARGELDSALLGRLGLESCVQAYRALAEQVTS